MKNSLPYADQIWQMINSFRGYSFCKAHSASYTRISFESAYLRCHFPAEFMAAVLSNGGGYYHTSAYISECMRMGIEILPLDINESDFRYKGKQNKIRIGFMAVKGLSEATIQNILIERKKNGCYQSLYDYLHRSNTSLIENQKLNHLSAFQGISSLNSSQIYWLMHQYYQIKNQDGQQELFSPIEPEPPFLQPPTHREKWLWQMQLLGYLINKHPIELWQETIAQTNISYIPAYAIKHNRGKVVTLIGFPITQKTAFTNSGKQMAFYSFEDQYALYDVTLFPTIYEKYKNLILEEKPCFLNGLIETHFDVDTITLRWAKKINPPNLPSI